MIARGDEIYARLKAEMALTRCMPHLPHKFRLGHARPAALLPLQGEPPYLFLLLERDGEFLLDALAVDRAGIIRAERIHRAVGRGVVDHAALAVHRPRMPVCCNSVEQDGIIERLTPCIVRGWPSVAMQSSACLSAGSEETT